MKLPINEIICGDCLEVMKDWPDNCVDLVVTSPPYNIGKGYTTYNDKMNWGEFMAWLLKIRRELSRICDNIVYIIGSHNNFEFLSKLRQQPLGEQRVIVLPTWSIVNPVEVAVYEFINRKKWSKKHRLPIICNGTIATFLPVIVGKTDTEQLFDGHPCTFPLRLPKAFISSLSDENDIICDPFMGVGSTAIAAKQLKRQWVGCDISEEYCKVARMRIKAVETGVPVKEQKAGQLGLFQ